MSVPKKVFFVALAALVAPAVFAQGGSVFVGGEAGWVDQPVRSTLTREQVRKEFVAFRISPEAPDGGRYVGGEEGYVNPQHTYAYRNGEWVCTDKIAHTPKPAPVTTAERQLFAQQYPA